MHAPTSRDTLAASAGLIGYQKQTNMKLGGEMLGKREELKWKTGEGFEETAFNMASGLV